MDSAALLSKLNLILESRLVLKAIVAGRAAHQLTALPIIEDASDVLACNAGHGGEVGLPDLLTNDDPSRPDFFPEMFCQLEQCSGHPAFERKEATGCHRRVCLAQAFSEKPDQRFVELWMFVCKSLERGVAEKAHCCITHRHHRRRTRQPIEDRKLTDDGAPAEEG